MSEAGFAGRGASCQRPGGGTSGSWTVSLALCWGKSLGQAGKGLGDQAGKSGDFSQEPSEMIFVRQEEDLVGEGWVDVSGEMQRMEEDLRGSRRGAEIGDGRKDQGGGIKQTQE